MAFKGSVADYPDRGKWGDARYRGNCSGRLIKDVIEQYVPKGGIFVDVTLGGGTSRDVVQDLFPGVKFLGLDLNPEANPQVGSFDFTKDSVRQAVERVFGRAADVCFSHPPYGPMIQYSGNMWGAPHESDTSRCSEEEFLEKSRFMLLNQRDAVDPGGLYMTLIGDRRHKGQYTSYQADFISMMPRNELRGIIIKTQHNCVSDARSYARMKHPRVLHEYLIVWERVAQTFVALSLDKAYEMKRRINGTWATVVRFSLMKLGGQATLDLIYRKVEEVAGDKARSNPTWQATVRRTLQQHFVNVQRGVWAVA